MDYTIELPVIPLAAMNLGYPVQGLIEVNKSSPFELLNSLEQLAKYFRREQGFDTVQFDASEVRDPTSSFRGFLFAESGLNHMTEEHLPVTPSLIIGGGCFRYRIFKGGDKRAFLDWIWIHPYERKKGKLPEHWPQLQKLANDDRGFFLTPPISRAMRAFLEKNWHKDALNPTVIENLDNIVE